MAPTDRLRRFMALALFVSPIQSLHTISLSTSRPPSAIPSDWRYPWHRNMPCRTPIRHGATAHGRESHTVRNVHAMKKRLVHVSLNAGSNEMETDEELIENLFKESVSESMPAISEVKEGTNKMPSHFIQGKAAIGIGGNAGFVYDVNALKRNLVQESVKGCKHELLVLLEDGRPHVAFTSKFSNDENQRSAVSPRWRRDRDDLIEERLSALVQANPVSTTTDSNLLDGKWSFAFATNSVSGILDTSRFFLSKTKRVDSSAGERRANSDVKGDSATVRGGPWRFRSGKTENPFRSSTRQIFLENLEGDENAHIVDETRLLGGLFQSYRRYDVYGLTRTALDLDLTRSESKILGLRVNVRSRDDFKGTKQGEPLEIQVIYLDTDLCICTTGAGLIGPLHVYTKSDSWVTGGSKRKLRLIAKTASWIATIQSPLGIRQRLLNAFYQKNVTSPGAKPGLKAVNIGELDVDDDGTTREDPAWDGPDDPFMHLSPGERMQVLRTMSLQDIYRSASERKEQNKKQKWKWWGNRSKKFKRPEK